MYEEDQPLHECLSINEYIKLIRDCLLENDLEDAFSYLKEMEEARWEIIEQEVEQEEF
jgi:pentatricopeptide repeat protein